MAKLDDWDWAGVQSLKPDKRRGPTLGSASIYLSKQCP